MKSFEIRDHVLTMAGAESGWCPQIDNAGPLKDIVQTRVSSAISHLCCEGRLFGVKVKRHVNRYFTSPSAAEHWRSSHPPEAPHPPGRPKRSLSRVPTTTTVRPDGVAVLVAAPFRDIRYEVTEEAARTSGGFMAEWERLRGT